MEAERQNTIDRTLIEPDGTPNKAKLGANAILAVPMAVARTELPGFTTAATGMAQTSLDALRSASATSYYKDKDALWVKVVSNGEGAHGGGPFVGGTSVQVSR